MFGHDTIDIDTPPLPAPPPEQTLENYELIDEKYFLKYVHIPGVWLAGKTFASLACLQELVEDWHHLLRGRVDI